MEASKAQWLSDVRACLIDYLPPDHQRNSISERGSLVPGSSKAHDYGTAPRSL